MSRAQAPARRAQHDDDIDNNNDDEVTSHTSSSSSGSSSSPSLNPSPPPPPVVARSATMPPQPQPRPPSTRHHLDVDLDLLDPDDDADDDDLTTAIRNSSSDSVDDTTDVLSQSYVKSVNTNAFYNNSNINSFRNSHSNDRNNHGIGHLSETSHLKRFLDGEDLTSSGPTTKNYTKLTEEFYQSYDPQIGLHTAAVLGGILGWLIVYVLYKTKVKRWIVGFVKRKYKKRKQRKKEKACEVFAECLEKDLPGPSPSAIHGAGSSTGPSLPAASGDSGQRGLYHLVKSHQFQQDFGRKFSHSGCYTPLHRGDFYPQCCYASPSCAPYHHQQQLQQQQQQQQRQYQRRRPRSVGDRCTPPLSLNAFEQPLDPGGMCKLQHHLHQQQPCCPPMPSIVVESYSSLPHKSNASSQRPSPVPPLSPQPSRAAHPVSRPRQQQQHQADGGQQHHNDDVPDRDSHHHHRRRRHHQQNNQPEQQQSRSGRTIKRVCSNKNPSARKSSREHDRIDLQGGGDGDGRCGGGGGGGGGKDGATGKRPGRGEKKKKYRRRRFRSHSHGQCPDVTVLNVDEPDTKSFLLPPCARGDSAEATARWVQTMPLLMRSQQDVTGLILKIQPDMIGDSKQQSCPLISAALQYAALPLLGLPNVGWNNSMPHLPDNNNKNLAGSLGDNDRRSSSEDTAEKEKAKETGFEHRCSLGGEAEVFTFRPQFSQDRSNSLGGGCSARKDDGMFLRLPELSVSQDRRIDDEDAEVRRSRMSLPAFAMDRCVSPGGEWERGGEGGRDSLGGDGGGGSSINNDVKFLRPCMTPVSRPQSSLSHVAPAEKAAMLQHHLHPADGSGGSGGLGGAAAGGGGGGHAQSVPLPLPPPPAHRSSPRTPPRLTVTIPPPSPPPQRGLSASSVNLAATQQQQQQGGDNGAYLQTGGGARAVCSAPSSPVPLPVTPTVTIQRFTGCSTSRPRPRPSGVFRQRRDSQDSVSSSSSLDPLLQLQNDCHCPSQQPQQQQQREGFHSHHSDPPPHHHQPFRLQSPKAKMSPRLSWTVFDDENDDTDDRAGSSRGDGGRSGECSRQNSCRSGYSRCSSSHLHHHQPNRRSAAGTSEDEDLMNKGRSGPHDAILTLETKL